MWILQSEFEELKYEFHGVEYSPRHAREELLDVITVALRMLIDTMNYEQLIEDKPNHDSDSETVVE